MAVNLGMIEGLFGKPWSWVDRTTVLQTLAGAGYRFYHYGPKADPFLRRRWMEPHPPEQVAALSAFAARCRALGVCFGVALTPVGSTHPFDEAARGALRRKLAHLDTLGIDDLAILFDDLPAELPDLARAQAELVDFCANNSRASRIFFCPSFYSDDPILERAWGRRPPSYLPDLGRHLDRHVQVYWTGEEVVSREIGVAHLQRVQDELGRKVCLWDNYPVNDGVRMSQHLHLRGFTGRPAAIRHHVSGHAINPASQPLLSCIPALTLAASYRQGARYAYGQAFLDAATVVLGGDFATILHRDILPLQDTGLDNLGARHAELRERYGAIDHSAAREITAWLDGHFRTTLEEVQTQ
ncbi:beta-N-acetylglucosaminidase domain-containing protein [Sphingomonas sp. Marseille-Q8236]